MSKSTTILLALIGSVAALSAGGMAPAEPANRFSGIGQLPATEWQVKGGGPKAIYCPLITQAPKLDGRLDDPCWKAAGKSFPFIKSDGGMAAEVPADDGTNVLLCRDDKNIYMAWTAVGKTAKENASSPKDRLRNDEGHYEDLLEASFQMIGGDDEYRFYMNSKGNTAAASHRAEDRYTGAFSAKSTPTENGAIIETCIPLSNPGLHVPKDGEWWKIRLNRVHNRLEWSAQNIENDGYDFVYFGSEKDFKQQAMPIPPKLRIYGERYAYDTTDIKTQFVAHVTGGLPKGAFLQLQLLKGDQQAAAQSIPSLTQPYLAFLFDQRGLEPGDYKMQATLLDQSGKEILKDAWAFKITDQAEPAIPFPDAGVPLIVHGQKELPDATWPVTTGVPLPRGAFPDNVSMLAVYEDGKEVPANIVPRATWYPTLDWRGTVPIARDGNSYRWVGVTFMARYTDGKPHKYTLNKLVALQRPVPKPSPLAVSEDAGQIVIVTGPAKLAVSKTAFAGVEAWLDKNNDGRFDEGEKVLLGGGPYVVDQNDKRYNSSGPAPATPVVIPAGENRVVSGGLGPVPKDMRTEVVVEESGPVRVVLGVKGWYHDENKNPLCVYNTRIIAYSGMPYFEVEQRTVLTSDNRKLKLEDIGFDLKTPRPAAAGSFGTDKGELPAITSGTDQAKAMPPAGWWSTSLHQDRNDHFRLIHEWTLDHRSPFPEQAIDSEGVRADGRASVAGKDFGVTVILRDVWEKYPKELEVGSNGVTLHFWPRHGYDTFTEPEVTAKENIHRALFDHQGKLLSLQLPDKVLAAINAYDLSFSHRTDAPKEAIYGYGPPALGVAVANDFFVVLSAGEQAEAKAPAAPLNAGLVRQNPSAYADPNYACATEAFDKIAPKDAKDFPNVEKAIEENSLAYYHFCQIAHSWGMFIYVQHNTEYVPGLAYPWPQPRLWSNSHYQDASLPWLLYFRSGNPEMLKWARAHTDNFMNIATCNYDDPAHPTIASNPDKTTKGFHVSLAGQMFHCKSPIPWGGPMASNGHFIDPQSYYMDYCLTGDYAAIDNYAQWVAALKRTPVEMEPHRDTNNNMAHLIENYGWSWDPYVLELIHQSAVPLLGTAFAKHDAGHFHKYWIPRYWELTRNPRVVERAKEWVADVGQVDLPVMAMLYDVTGDKKYLPVVERGPASYYNPADPWNGFSDSAFQPYGGFVYSSLPGGLYALKKAGLTEDAALPVRGMSPQSTVSYKDRAGRDCQAEILLFKKQDQPFELVMENGGVNQEATSILCLAPDGKPLGPPTTTKRDGRYIGPNILRVKIPADGKTGLYQLSLQQGGNSFCFFMPASGLPGEAAVLRPNGNYLLNGPEYCVSPRTGHEGPITLEFTANGTGSIRMTDDKGGEILTASISKGLMTNHAAVTADPKAHPLPWSLEVIGEAQLRVSPVDRLYLAPDKSHLLPILENLRTVVDPKAPMRPMPAKS